MLFTNFIFKHVFLFKFLKLFLDLILKFSKRFFKNYTGWRRRSSYWAWWWWWHCATGSSQSKTRARGRGSRCRCTRGRGDRKRKGHDRWCWKQKKIGPKISKFNSKNAIKSFINVLLNFETLIKYFNWNFMFLIEKKICYKLVKIQFLSLLPIF